MTRIGLLLTGDADVGVSITSIFFALLTLVATYALGALVASPIAGLAAAAMLAIDKSAVYWAIGGWRDELFAFFAVSCAWAWTRFARDPTRANAVLAGAAQRRRLPHPHHDARAHRARRHLAAGDEQRAAPHRRRIQCATARR